MKPLSETLTEQGIAFNFPIEIRDGIGRITYCENSEGVKKGHPKSSKTCEGKVIEVDGIKYELRSL